MLHLCRGGLLALDRCSGVCRREMKRGQVLRDQNVNVGLGRGEIPVPGWAPMPAHILPLLVPALPIGPQQPPLIT